MKPSVACEIVRNMGFFLDNVSMSSFERIVFLNLVEFVRVVSCHQYCIVVIFAEWALINQHIPSDSNLLESEAFLFIPHPQNNLPIWLTSLW